jgi:uncharacterized BrkB/YihY/UPF0761 family membrane protein
MGEFAQALRSQAQPAPKTSYRWLLKAALTSIALAVLLVFVVFLVNVIPSAMYSSETKWTDFTPEQWASMKLWYFVLLGGGAILIFLFFFLRKGEGDD